MKTTLWKEEGYGELHGNLLRFKTKGFWKRTTEIRDIEGSTVLGSIHYNHLKSTATITYQDLNYHWQFNSWTRKKWVVSSETDTASFELKSFWKNEGAIENEDIPAAIILTALYVHGHYRRISSSS
ncbi:hypothetical protein [Dyadobacter pollutisoli]|uniref:Uncharacterized protein n=1 Tax=Dyadobacter pollutisoli TaxID=2910158 RepID=A0A9E8N909_9BACT|nr:hypothetical protein [Dyadobacter pollutisoli]WAC10963.1 hypothetical protein ON006_24850 [Dyadobacter pollutisoli]